MEQAEHGQQKRRGRRAEEILGIKVKETLSSDINIIREIRRLIRRIDDLTIFKDSTNIDSVESV